MKLTKSRPKSELEQLKEFCKEQGIDYNKTKLVAEYTIDGKIKSLETDEPIILDYLKSNGFK